VICGYSLTRILANGAVGPAGTGSQGRRPNRRRARARIFLRADPVRGAAQRGRVAGRSRAVGRGWLLFCRGTPPHASYLFKHALVQDAAYGTLMRGRRQELHTRVAAVLEERFADLVERQPEVLAHHLTAAGNSSRAVDQWLKAGRHDATVRFAYPEAMAHLKRGLAALPSLPEGPARDRREIELQLALGLCSFTAEGAVAALPAYTRAHELADEQGSPRQRFEALYGVWQSRNVSGGIGAARPFSDRLLRMSEQEQD
jgi:predicted ATPase